MTPLDISGSYRSSWKDESVLALAAVADKFFDTELVANRERFEQQKAVDKALWRQAGDIGLLCCSIPEEYGGGGGTIAHDLAVPEAQARAGDLAFGNGSTAASSPTTSSRTGPRSRSSVGFPRWRRGSGSRLWP